MTLARTSPSRKALAKVGVGAALVALFGSVAVPAHAAPEHHTITAGWSQSVVNQGDSLVLSVRVDSTVPGGTWENVSVPVTLPSFATWVGDVDFWGCGGGLSLYAPTAILWTPQMHGTGSCTLTVPLTAISGGTSTGSTVSSPQAGSITQPGTLVARSTSVAAPTVSGVRETSVTLHAPSVGAAQGYPDFAYYSYFVTEVTTDGPGRSWSAVSTMPSVTFVGLPKGAQYTASLDLENAARTVIGTTGASNFTTADAAPLALLIADVQSAIDNGTLADDTMTVHSWQALQAALSAASALVDPTVEQLAAAELALRTARDGVVDNTALRDAVARAQLVDLAAGGYTRGTAQAFTAALNEAVATIAASHAQTAQSVADLASRLDAAADNLIAAPSSLTELVDHATELLSGPYTSHSRTLLGDARAAVFDLIMLDPAPSSGDLAAVEAALRAAIDGLVDTTELWDALAAIEDVDTQHLTAASLRVLYEEELALTALVSSTGPVSNADVSAATSRANAALSSLASIKPLLDVLERFILGGYDEEDFTPTSVERFLAVTLDLSDTLPRWMSDPTATVTQAEIDAAAARMAKAIDNLVLVTDSGVVITHNGEPISGGADLKAGDTITITSKALEPGSVFRAELHSTPIELGRMTVGADGVGRLTVTLPIDVSGSHTLHVYWVERGASVATDTGTAVDVAAAPAPVVAVVTAIDHLQVTGGTLGALTPALALLLLGGAFTVFAAARRRSLLA